MCQYLVIILKIFSATLRKANDKARQAIYTSDMDTDKELISNRKYRARKLYSSSGSEEELCTDVNLPPVPCPPKRKYTKKCRVDRGVHPIYVFGTCTKFIFDIFYIYVSFRVERSTIVRCK